MKGRKRQRKKRRRKLLKNCCNTTYIWCVGIILALYTFQSQAQTPVDKLLLLQNGNVAFTSYFSIFAGIKHPSQLTALQEQIAALQYNSYHSNIMVYYSQDGDKWLSEKNLYTYYNYKAINNNDKKLHFGLNVRYHSFYFHERDTKGGFNYFFNAKYQWHKNSWVIQFFLNMDNGAIPIGSSIRVGRYLTNNFSIEIQPKYDLDAILFTSIIRIKYSIYQYFTFLLEQHFTHWMSDFSITYEYKKLQVILKTSWHQYTGDVWQAYLSYKPIK